MARVRSAALALGRLALRAWGVVCLGYAVVVHPWVCLAAALGLVPLCLLGVVQGRRRRPVVLMTESGLVRRVGGRPSEQVLWDEVERVTIVCTGGRGDNWWLVEGAHGTGVVVPWNHAPAALLGRLQRLTGFDSRAVITACGAWEEQVLQAWPALSPP